LKDEAASAGFPPHGMVALQTDGERWREVWRLQSG
jgi:hypothetical protein